MILQDILNPTFRRLFGLLGAVSLPKAAYLAFRRGDLSIIPYRRTAMRASGSQFNGPGRVHIGANAPNSPTVAGHFILHENAKCRLEGNFSILSGCRIDVYQGAALTLGNGYINAGGRLQCYSAISIGDGTFIGENFRAMDWDQHSIDGRDSAPQPIHIGASVWIGAGVTVLKGVTIGDGAVVGAGSVVTRDIGAHRLAVGIPAREVSDVSWR